VAVELGELVDGVTWHTQPPLVIRLREGPAVDGKMVDELQDSLGRYGVVATIELLVPLPYTAGGTAPTPARHDGKALKVVVRFK
jgi:hypothetical protein